MSLLDSEFSLTDMVYNWQTAGQSVFCVPVRCRIWRWRVRILFNHYVDKLTMGF